MNNVLRFGMVIRINPDRLKEYRALHADSNSGVRDLLQASCMRNFSIFVHQLPDSHHYLFGYYEYNGSDYQADMEKLAKEPRNQAWLSICDPIQIPLPGQRTWVQMESIYYNS